MQQQHAERREKWTFNTGLFDISCLLFSSLKNVLDKCGVFVCVSVCPRSRYCHQQHQRDLVILCHGL